MRIRPVKVGLVALAIAIFLWGFAYKISRFQVHRTTLSRVSAFRLWDESRHARAVADVLRKFQTEPTPAAAEALISLDSFPPRADERRIGFVAALLPTQPALASSLPSRAPPRPRCFLA